MGRRSDRPAALSRSRFRAAALLGPLTSPSRLWIAALAVLLAFAFIGSRGVWDPDEGRYTNVALHMLDSGDWLNPMRSDDTGHWTKPPLTYWLIAASVAAFGQHAGVARLPIALSYLACVALVWQLARRLAPGAESSAAAIYATMLLPLGAAQLVTTDFPLTALQTAAMTALVEARADPARGARWIALGWLATALAFLTKGPPALLPLLAIALYAALVREPGARRYFGVTGAIVFAAVALPWFVIVTQRHPGLLDHFLGSEVVRRVASDDFGRHGEWYGWLQVYAPTLIVGSLPWTGAVWRWSRTLPAHLRRWRDPARRRADAPLLLLTLWLLVPLLVLCLARSRLPLYVLPLFVPLALLVARQRRDEGRNGLNVPGLIGWLVLMLALKAAAAGWPSHKDASQWADTIAGRAPFAVTEVVFVEDMARYGLHLHLGAKIEKIALDPIAGAGFTPEYDEDLATELAECGGATGVVWIAKQARYAEVAARIAGHGYLAEPLGAPYRERVLFTVRAAAASGPDTARAAQ